MHLAMRLHLAAAAKRAKKPASKAIALPAEAPEGMQSEPEETPDYEELDDGSFKCLHCEKVYQPSSRAEGFMKKHVTKEHL